VRTSRLQQVVKMTSAASSLARLCIKKLANMLVVMVIVSCGCGRSWTGREVLAFPSPHHAIRYTPNNLLRCSMRATLSTDITEDNNVFVMPKPLSSCRFRDITDCVVTKREPLVLQDVFAFNRDKWLDDMLFELGPEVIDYDVRLSGMILESKRKNEESRRLLEEKADINIKEQSHLIRKKSKTRSPAVKSFEIETYQSTFREFLSQVMQYSSHDDNLYFMTETLLQNHAKTLVVQPELTQLPTRLFGPDWFSFFPQTIRPKSALVVGGKGARSFLHSDPFDWLGWNYLFEGEKLCKCLVLLPCRSLYNV
jgi:hypothetical protein